MMTEYRFGRLWQTPRKEKEVIGILEFEAASSMSKLVELWKSLDDDRIESLRKEIMTLEGVRQLVSKDDDYLHVLVLAEMFNNLGFVAQAIIRLSKRCSNPMMESLEALLDDMVKKSTDPFGLEYNWIKMGRKVKKMERFVAGSRTLYEEMETLSETQKGLEKMRGSGVTNRSLKHEVAEQMQVVKVMRENSLWSRSYNYTVRLLVRSWYTIFRRMKVVFGVRKRTVLAMADSGVLNYLHLPHNQSVSSILHTSVHPSENNPIRVASSPLKSPTCTISCTLHSFSGGRLLAGSRSFRGCITVRRENRSLLPQSFNSMSHNSRSEGILKELSHVELFINSNYSFFSSKCRLMSSPPLFTLGAAALELHYANVIVAIEKFFTCDWILPEERDDLYRMLPASIRTALRTRLKSFAKNLKPTDPDAGLAKKCTDEMERTLKWLAPLAHNTKRRHSQWTLELKEHLLSRTNVLLIQTLHFANQAKTEAVIMELLLGLNYICRFRFQEEEVGLEEKGCIHFGNYLNGKE